MNELQAFNYNGSQVRTVEKDGQFWWVLKDVCDVLGLSNTRVVAERLDDDERSKLNLHRQGDTWCINESGLYNVILRSDKPEARPFRKWVTSEVLPAIRKTGTYNAPMTDKLAEMKIIAAANRAAAMKMNAENRRLKLLLDHPHLKDLSPIAQQTFVLKSVESVTHEDMSDALPECGKLYGAGQLATLWTKEFGVKVTANMLGILANRNGLKTEENGITAMDKSPHSAKEVPSFRYNSKGADKLKVLAMEHYGVAK